MNFSISLIVTLSLAGQMSADAENARKTRGALIEEGTVSFSKNSTKLSSDAKAKLEALIEQLKQASSTKNLILVGHTDTKGSEARRSKLAIRRATQVQSFLVKMGLDREMIFTTGVGPSEPIAADETPVEHEKNRRVELWTTEQKPIGTISWSLNNTQVLPASASDWSPAETGAEIFRNHRLQADESSAGEITFFKQTKIFVSPDSAIIAYDTRRLQGRPSKRTPDVFVEAGTIVVRKLSSAASTIRVDTADAQIDMNARHARVRFDAKTKVSTISIMDGSARVRARGRTVSIGSGETARIVERGIPIKSNSLPRTPLWVSPSPVLVHGDAPTQITWRPPSRTATTIAEFTFPSDEGFERPIQTMPMMGSTASLSGLPPGAYLLRLITRTPDGLISAPSPAIKLIALAQPTTMAQVPVLVDKGIVRMPGPGILYQSAPEGMTVLLGEAESENPAGTQALWNSGRYKVPYRLILGDGETLFGGGAFKVNVARASIKLLKLTPEVVGEYSRTPVQMRILGEGEQPITGLKFKIFLTSDSIKGLEKLQRNVQGEQRGLLQPCKCEAPEGAVDMIEQGNGYYAYVYQRMAGQSFRKDRLRIFEQQSTVVQEFVVPIGAYVAPAPEEVPSGVIGTFRVGAQLAHQFEPKFRGDIDLGYRFHLIGVLSLDLTAHVGLFPTSVDRLNKTTKMPITPSDDALVLPLEGRGGFSILFDKGGFYLGGGGGVGFVFSDNTDETKDQFVKPMQNLWSSYFGLFYQVGPGEFLIQADYGPQLLGGQLIESNLWPSVTIGFRVAPWISKSKAIKVGNLDLSEINVGDVNN